METWIIDTKAETSKDVRATVRSDKTLEENWPAFKRDVTTNPYFHPKPKRIEKLRGSEFPEGIYRYKKNALRVVYFPNKPDRTIYPLEAASAMDVSYKKRSSKRSRKSIKPPQINPSP